MSDEEVKKAEDKRFNKNRISFKLQNWVKKGLTKKQERGGKRNKRKTKKNNKRKNTQKKKMRKNKKSKRKTRR